LTNNIKSKLKKIIKDELEKTELKSEEELNSWKKQLTNKMDADKMNFI